MIFDPLPNLTEQQPIDFDGREVFDFYFDIAFAPAIPIKLSKEDTLPYYKIILEDEKVDEEIERQRQNFSTFDDTIEEAAAEDLIKGTVTELEDGQPKEGGIVVDDAVLMPKYLKDDEAKNIFIGAAKGATLIFNPRKIYESASNVEAELSAFLKIEKERVADVTGDVSFEIKEITRSVLAELNTEYFDKIFGKGVVTNEEEYRDMTRKEITKLLDEQSDYKLLLDARPFLEEKAGEITLADDLIKRRLKLNDAKITDEKVEEDYPSVVDSLKYSLIRDAIFEDNQIEVYDDDMRLLAELEARNMFAKYGVPNVEQEQIAQYAQSILADEKYRSQIFTRIESAKLLSWLKETVTLEEIAVTQDEFAKFFQPATPENVEPAAPEE
jgi:trigger factor